MQDAVAVFKCRLTHKSHRQCGTKHTRLNIKKQNVHIGQNRLGHPDINIKYKGMDKTENTYEK